MIIENSLNLYIFLGRFVGIVYSPTKYVFLTIPYLTFYIVTSTVAFLSFGENSYLNDNTVVSNGDLAFLVSIMFSFFVKVTWYFTNRNKLKNLLEHIQIKYIQPPKELSLRKLGFWIVFWTCVCSLDYAIFYTFFKGMDFFLYLMYFQNLYLSITEHFVMGKILDTLKMEYVKLSSELSNTLTKLKYHNHNLCELVLYNLSKNMDSISYLKVVICTVNNFFSIPITTMLLVDFVFLIIAVHYLVSLFLQPEPILQKLSGMPTPALHIIITSMKILYMVKNWDSISQEVSKEILQFN